MQSEFEKNDYIHLSDMRFIAFLGVTKEERSGPQSILIDIKMQMDLYQAAETDVLGDTVNYQEIQTAIKEHLKNNEYKLIETLCDRLINLIFEKWSQIKTIGMKIKKPTALKDTEFAAVHLYRERKS